MGQIMKVTRLQTTEVRERVCVRHPREVVPILQDFYKDDIGEKENFIAISLSRSNEVKEIRTVAVGSVSGVQVHPREVFRHAILDNASAIILAHNHPSGNVAPSDADIFVTKRLKDAGGIIGIEILDHIIVSKTEYYSFVENDCL